MRFRGADWLRDRGGVSPSWLLCGGVPRRISPPSYEFLGIYESKVVKKPYGKYRFMVYFTITKQDYCEVQSRSLIDALEKHIQDESTYVYIRIIKWGLLRNK